jgi:hypothetical protein
MLTASRASARDVPVKSAAELTAAIGAASPGDVIILAMGATGSPAPPAQQTGR